MRVALDTNILVYAEGIAALPGDAEKPGRARALIEALPAETVVVPAQVLGELYRVLAGKAGRPVAEARAALLTWSDLYATADTTTGVMLSAVDLAADHRLSIWDAVIVAAAVEAGCRLLLSEDMQDGFVWHGLTVVNPFAATPHPLLRALCGG